MARALAALEEPRSHLLVLLDGHAVEVHRTPKFAELDPLGGGPDLFERLASHDIKDHFGVPYGAQILSPNAICQATEFLNAVSSAKEARETSRGTQVYAASECRVACIHFQAMIDEAVGQPFLYRNVGRAVTRAARKLHEAAKQLHALPNHQWAILPVSLKVAAIRHDLDRELRDFDVANPGAFRMTAEFLFTDPAFAGLIEYSDNSPFKVCKHVLEKVQQGRWNNENYWSLRLHPFRIIPRSVISRLAPKLVNENSDRFQMTRAPLRREVEVILHGAARSLTWNTVRPDSHPAEAFEREFKAWRRRVALMHWSTGYKFATHTPSQSDQSTALKALEVGDDWWPTTSGKFPPGTEISG
jgi:hypothetical protein